MRRVATRVARPEPGMGVGIDLSFARSAIAWRRDGKVECPVFLTQVSDCASEREKAERLYEITSWVTRTVREINPAWIALENYAYAGPKLVPLAELGGAVKHELLRILGMAVIPVPVTTARLLVFGKGNLKKPDVVRLARDAEPRLRQGGDDECDAWVVLRAVERAYEITTAQEPEKRLYASAVRLLG